MQKVICPLILLLTSASLLYPIDPNRENPTYPSKFTFERKLIFYAVLEGLFEDGVAGEALELILPDARSMTLEDAPEKTNFVYACPICMPTFDALRLYQARLPFYAQKGTKYNTYGLGLSEEIMKELRGTPFQRRDAIEALINQWIQRRLDNLKLTDCERDQVEENLSAMRKKGEEMLKRFQSEKNYNGFKKYYENWKKCAACSGASPLKRWLEE